MQTIVFTLLFGCSTFCLFLGSYIYRTDKKSKINYTFYNLCVCCSLWTIGYAIMLISPNIKFASIWRIISSLGYCLFPGFWLYFGFLLKNECSDNPNWKIRPLVYIPSAIFFIRQAMIPQSKVMLRQYYGWIDANCFTGIDIVFYTWFITFFAAGLVLIFLWGRDSKKNRIKKQARIILITSTISFIIGTVTDIILPSMGAIVFPSSAITLIIAMGGIYYAISRHRMMSITPKVVSEYIFNAVNEPVFILDENFHIKNCNEAAIDMAGCEYEELKYKPIKKLINIKNLDFNILMQKGKVDNIEVNLENRYGFVYELSGMVIYDEYKDMLAIVILMHDISERKKIALMEKENTLKLEETNLILRNQIRDKIIAEERLNHLVYYDVVTEIPNRKMMLDSINKLINDKKQKFAVIFIDLDGFKIINDNYGHQVGDNALRVVADRLKGIAGANNIVSRIGGDEFIVLLENLQLISQAEEFAAIISEKLKESFDYNGIKLSVEASIGISIFPNHGIDEDTLIRNADLAMYEVKNNGGNGYTVYSEKYSPQLATNFIYNYK